MRTRLALACAALALGACATLDPPNDVFAATHVKPGVSTKADVDKLLGKPYESVRSGSTRTEATYGYRDIWGYAMALFVTYDEKGVVVARYAERRAEN
jgi:peptidoglycan hydrolase-like protein with peptidoglycan-binding domain